MKRGDARELAVHLIYGRAFTGEEPEQVVSTRLDKEYYGKLAEENEVYAQRPDRFQLRYIDSVVTGVANREDELDDVIRQLIDIQYDRNDMDFHRGTFRVRGDVLEIFPAEETDKAVRVEFFGDEVERISEVNCTTGEILLDRSHVAIFPASHYATGRDKLVKALGEIEHDMQVRVEEFKAEDKLIEAQRIEQRTTYDMEMMLSLIHI